MIAEDTTLCVYLVRHKEAETIDSNKPDKEFTLLLEGDLIFELIGDLFLDLSF